MIKHTLIIVLLATISLFSKITHHSFTADFVGISEKELPDSSIKISKYLLAKNFKTDISEIVEKKSRHMESAPADSILKEINGFKVQVYKSEKITKAKDKESLYIEMFGEGEVTLIFEKPFYKIRVGNLRDREEAEEYIKMLKSRGIRRGIIVPDRVLTLVPKTEE